MKVFFSVKSAGPLENLCAPGRDRILRDPVPLRFPHLGEEFFVWEFGFFTVVLSENRLKAFMK